LNQFRNLSGLETPLLVLATEDAYTVKAMLKKILPQIVLQQINCSSSVRGDPPPCQEDMLYSIDHKVLFLVSNNLFKLILTQFAALILGLLGLPDLITGFFSSLSNFCS